ncbi:nucleotidyltransferase family protein [Desulfothermus okinawensis JCM 13304]
MIKSKIVKELEEIKKRYQEHIIKIGLFGSYARGENTADSDIDIVIEQKQPDLLLLGRIKIELEEKLNKPVDVIRMRENINPFLKKRIEKDVIYV